MKTGIELIAEERQRQVEVEGWTAKHDKDENWNGQMARAAASYALGSKTVAISLEYIGNSINVRHRIWPWLDYWWKPSPDNRIRELQKAGALIAAEIDRLQVVTPNTPTV